MKWPWVSRAELAYERDLSKQVIHNLRSALAVADARSASSESRYDALLEKYHELRVAGASAPTPAIPVTLRAQKPADEAIEAAVSRFNGNAMLRKRLQKYVHAERMKEDYDESAELTIANKVLHWSDPDEDAA